jgi:hypothetical protein
MSAACELIASTTSCRRDLILDINNLGLNGVKFVRALGNKIGDAVQLPADPQQREEDSNEFRSRSFG